MHSRFCRLSLEQLEDRSVPSTVAAGDFNNDGLMDMAALTSPTTITVSLANPDGTYNVSDTLRAPKSLPTAWIDVGDYNGDGNLDISGGGVNTRSSYSHLWFGNGDGTFSNRSTVIWNGSFGDGL